MTWDCRTCGACCVSEHDSETYVDLDSDDVARLPAAKRKYLVVLDHLDRPCLGTKRERSRRKLLVCALHMGSVGTSSRCSIYGVRPNLCRSFEPGSRACRIAREDVGLPTK